MLFRSIYVNALGDYSHDDAVAFVPQRIDRMDFYFETGLASRVYADGHRSQDDTTQSLTIVDDADRVVASLQNVKYGTENRSSFTAASEKVQQVEVAGGAPIAAAEAGILARLQAAPEHERYDLLVGFIKIQIVEILNLDDAEDQEQVQRIDAEQQEEEQDDEADQQFESRNDHACPNQDDQIGRAHV